jgi:hypothetical protein
MHAGTQNTHDYRCHRARRASAIPASGAHDHRKKKEYCPLLVGTPTLTAKPSHTDGARPTPPVDHGDSAASLSGTSLSPTFMYGSRTRFPSIGFSGRIQMFRNRTGLPWSCS